MENRSIFSEKKNVRYLLCVIDVFAKYAWVKPLTNKKVKTVFYAFMEIVNESNHKTNKFWLRQGRKF